MIIILFRCKITTFYRKQHHFLSISNLYLLQSFFAKSQRLGYQKHSQNNICHGIHPLTAVAGYTGKCAYQIDLPKHNRLMKTIDRLNGAYGRDTVRIAAADAGKYEMRRNMLSPRYTTRMDEVMRVKS
jgi:hypothetical protein